MPNLQSSADGGRGRGRGDARCLAATKKMVDAERDKQRALSLRKRNAKAKAQVQVDVDAQDTTPSMDTTAPTSQHAVPVAEGGVDSERKDDTEVIPVKAPRFDAGVFDA